MKLLIIDEIHLLHDDRGAVIESIVARTVRQIEVRLYTLNPKMWHAGAVIKRILARTVRQIEVGPYTLNPKGRQAGGSLRASSLVRSDRWRCSNPKPCTLYLKGRQAMKGMLFLVRLSRIAELDWQL